MNAESFKALQKPIKDKYREQPDEALITLHAESNMDEGIACSVQTGTAMVKAGLHPATGGDGSLACSGDMLLQALAACAGVTLKAVATGMDIGIKSGRVIADGDLDFRGTLGVDRSAPVGFKQIRLRFELDTDAAPEKVEKLIQLTERYCVVLQTLRNSPVITVENQRSDG